jgi:hypothetical protein
VNNRRPALAPNRVLAWTEALAGVSPMRGTLTDNELRFLVSQGLGPDDFFDARWIHNGRRKRLMEAEHKTAALGTPCQKAGHGLRTSAGQCTQRDTSKPAFQSRHRRDRYVYIAGSLLERLLKIGTCSDCKQMGHQLRTEKYGSVGDWRIIYSIEVPNAVDVERAARSRLRECFVKRSYVKDGSTDRK